MFHYVTLICLVLHFRRHVWRRDLLETIRFIRGKNECVPAIVPECVARVPVSLWGSGGWGCVRQTLRNRPQPFATRSPHSTLDTLHFTLHTLHFNTFTLHTLHFTLCTPHSTLYTPHSTLYSPLYTLHLTLHSLHLTLHTPHFSLTPRFTLHTLHFALCTPYFTLYPWDSTLYTLHFTLYTLHFTLYTPHFTLYTPQFTLYTLYSTLYTVHCYTPPHSTLYTLLSTLYTLLSTLYIPHSTLYTLHSAAQTLHSTLHTPHLHFILHTPHSYLHSTLYTPHFTLHTLHFALSTTLCTSHSILHTFHPTLYRRKFRSQTSDNMDRWKAEMGRVSEEKRRRKKIQVREKVGKSRNIVFFRFVAPEGRKVGPLERRVRIPRADERWKIARRCGAKSISKAKCTKHTFGHWDVEKVHAVVAQSTFRSQKCIKLRGSEHFWKLRCRKSARRCGAKHISKSKVQKTVG